MMILPICLVRRDMQALLASVDTFFFTIDNF
jgi:hypothetical protein